jgi:hypothetical protein
MRAESVACVTCRAAAAEPKLQVQVSLPATAFPSESWRFWNVAEPEPSVWTVTDMTLESTWSYSVPFGPVSSTEFPKVLGSE